MRVSQVVFWQPNLSHHNISMIRQLTSHYESVTVCVVERMSQRRKTMGWDEPDSSGISVQIIPNQNSEILFKQLNHPSAVHVFSGTRGYKPIWKILKFAMKSKAIFGFQAETRNWKDFLGIIRYLQSSFEAVRIKGSVSFVLGIGDLGVRWYKRVGYPSSKIFDWAYFTSDASKDINGNKENGVIRFVYVGRLSKEKGIIPLINEIKSIAGSWELHILGNGPLKDMIEESIGDNPKFKLHGLLPLEAVGAEVESMDYLILPSVGKDGWGAVVNESLQLGVPCIVSQYAGAACLISNEKIGRTFDPRKNGSLRSILKVLIENNSKPTLQQRLEIKAHASTISSSSGALYLKNIFSYLFEDGERRPEAPWKMERSKYQKQ